MYGAGAYAREVPIFQMQSFAFLRRNLAGAQLVRERGSAAAYIFVSRYRPQPTHRLLQERFRRHQRARRSGIKRLEDIANQTPIVRQRYPSDERVFFRIIMRLLHHLFVCQHIAVAHHHALRRRERSRGVLQNRQSVGVNRRAFPVRRKFRRNRLRCRPADAPQLRMDAH